MNRNAEQHCAKARDYADGGEELYCKAAEEIGAARKEGATWTEINDYLGRGDKYAQRIAAWEEVPANERASTPFSEEQGAVAKRHARAVLRSASPEQVAEILEDPDIRRNVAKAQELRHTEQKQRSEKAYREAIGEDTADALDSEQHLRDAESKAFEARRALRDMLALLNETDLDAMRDSWREDFLKTLDDLAMRVDVARSLLGGTLDADLERFLSEV